MKAVSYKSESEQGTIMKTNIAKKLNEKISGEIKVVPEKETTAFDRIKNLIEKSCETENLWQSLRGQLLIECSLLTLNPKYKIHKVVENKKFQIPTKELNLWIKSVYDGGLVQSYGKIAFPKFKEDYPRHYQALVNVSKAVHLYIGRFHNANSDFNSIPLCKVYDLEGNKGKHNVSAIDTQKKDFTVEKQGTFYDGHKVFMNLEFLNNLDNSKDYPIRDRVMTSENGFNETVISGIDNGQIKYFQFSINQIINMASPIVNYAEFSEKLVKQGQEKFVQNCEENSTLMQEAEETQETVLNSEAEKTFLNSVDTFITESLRIDSPESVLELLKKINESLDGELDFYKFLDSRKFVFVARQYKEGNLYNSVRDYLNKQ